LIKDDKDIILIDSGNDEDGKYIVEYLKELGISKINYLVGTHEHEDHIGGMNYIVDNFDIQDIYLTRTDSSKENVEYNELLQTIANKNCTYEEPNTNTKFILGDSTFIIRYVSNIESNPNNDSIVIELENENLKYLFTGDIEQKIEKTVAWDSIDVLKVAHHGSDTSTSQDFLNVIFSEKNKLREKITVISTGNRENLLDDIVLQRLHAIPNNKIYITRNDGSIYITNIDGKNSVKTLRTKVDSTQH
jgi:beta-lactamase superfamily II metal-dependent hydrolase